ncbi:MAG: UDP-N-acetylenolpyruvoylglucosamine reductase [Planctomycetes bacterium RBG_13_62_9]|nr:MAG: UDP-N-acetylenolpyruvoylglucosamine reductase [Planctomycetes bacterium RBG_13_62_9]
MSIFSGFETIVEQDHPLAPHTWYRLGGPADYFIRPRNVKELKEVVRRCNENHIRLYVLGFGSDLLVSDEGVRGAVIKLQGEEFGRTQFEGQRVTAWAGAELSKLVLDCVEKGLSGVEGLMGIPGSIGGAVRMNAGGSFGDIGSAVESVMLMDIHGNVFEKRKPELIFDYRSVNIRARFVLNAQLKLTEADPEKIMRTVKEGWIYKKNTQPLNTRSCGCVFKNPPGAAAGALIDRAGLKGMQVGGAVVSDKHANFIIAKDGCTSRDVMGLIEVIKQKVHEQFDVELELELEVWQ